MKGPRFLKLSEEKIADLNDLEEMYTLLIQSRTMRYRDFDDFDEKISLISLCQIAYPGKTRIYQEQIIDLRKQFRGIFFDINMQIKFSNMISLSFKNATSPENLDFTDISNIFEEPPITNGEKKLVEI